MAKLKAKDTIYFRRLRCYSARSSKDPVALTTMIIKKNKRVTETPLAFPSQLILAVVDISKTTSAQKSIMSLNLDFVCKSRGGCGQCCHA